MSRGGPDIHGVSGDGGADQPQFSYSPSANGVPNLPEANLLRALIDRAAHGSDYASVGRPPLLPPEPDPPIQKSPPAPNAWQEQVPPAPDPKPPPVSAPAAQIPLPGAPPAPIPKGRQPTEYQIGVYRTHEALRNGAARKDPPEAPSQWPPEDKHRLDTFDHKYWNKQFLVPEYRFTYGPAQRKPRGDPPGLFTPEYKARFRRALRRAYTMNITFKRIVGHGGNGLAALFDVGPMWFQRKRCPKDVVVKLTLSSEGDRNVLHEKCFVDKCARAQHILKRVRLWDVLEDEGLKYALGKPHIFTRDAGKVGEPETGSGKALVLETASLGTLHGQLTRLASANRDAKNSDGYRWLQAEECWRMFECLVKACVAMKYPPALQLFNQPTHGKNNIIYADGPDIPEVVPPPGQRGNDVNIVHFDLDPQNIFVGDYSVPPRKGPPALVGGRLPHSRTPVFKVGDLGLAEEWTKETAMRSGWAWSHRKAGKTAWLFPEQWTVEWDGYSGNPIKGEPSQAGRDCKKPPSIIAGRYGEKSNIWCIGMCMHNALTLSMPRDQPWAERVKLGGALSTVLETPDGRKPRKELSGFTHGWRLAHDTQLSRDGTRTKLPLRWGHIPHRLRGVVMQCLMNNPEDRPDLEALLKEVAYQVKQYDGTRTRPTAWDTFNEPVAPPSYQPKYENINPGLKVGSAEWHSDDSTDLENLADEYQEWMIAVGIRLPINSP